MILQEWLAYKYTKKEEEDLDRLDCTSCSISSLAGIENLINLQELYCSGNNLTTLKGIENLPKLTKLVSHLGQMDIHKEQRKIKNIIRKEKIKNILE